MSRMSKITHVFFVFCIMIYLKTLLFHIMAIYKVIPLHNNIHFFFFFLNTSVTDITAYKTSPTQPPACYRANKSIIYFDVWDFVTEGILQTQPQLLHLSNTHCLP